MSEKLYTVKSGDTVRIVAANNKVAALRHVAQSAFQVTLASNQELIELTKAGVEVERPAAAQPAAAEAAE
jgi:hypothetical protein